MKNNSSNLVGVPVSLREKFVSSEVSREIFFIDCINDLNYCRNSNINYDLIRSSVLLRMLILDGGIETIAKKYNFIPTFKAFKNTIEGNPIENKEISNNSLIEILSDENVFTGKIDFINISSRPLKNYDLSKFIKIICLKIEGSTDYCFSVENIIKIISNKHGAAHLESSYISSTRESFHLGEYSPFSLSKDHFFLNSLKEIIFILIESLKPLIVEIRRNLIISNGNISQAEVSATFKILKTEEEFKKIILDKKSI